MAVLGTHLARMVRAIFAQLGELLFGFLVQVAVVDGCTSDSESYESCDGSGIASLEVAETGASSRSGSAGSVSVSQIGGIPANLSSGPLFSDALR